MSNSENRKRAVTDQEKLIAELIRKSDHKTLAIWAADCAKRVLPYFEEKYPKDNRPRKAIEAGRAWVRGELQMTEARKAAFAAHAAARDAEKDSGACAAARATGHAAATAHVPSHAMYATKYAITAMRDANETNNADTATFREREWQYQHLLELGEIQRVSRLS